MSKEAGRPTLYTEDIVTKAEEYLASCEDELLEKDGKTIYKVRLPTVERMALTLGVSRDTLYEWAKHHESFSDILEKLKALQADRLITEGLAGNYNSTIAKLILSAKHDMREKSDVTTDGKSLPTPLLSGLHESNDSE